MNLPHKIKYAIRDLFLPGPEAKYDQRRSARITILAILAGIVLAVGFGFALYYLNQIGRLR
jgi:hypothetical protein